MSSPRSGNSWLSAVLHRVLGLRMAAVHNPRDIPSLEMNARGLRRLSRALKRQKGEDCQAASPFPTPLDDILVQLHWYREPNFQAYLQQHRFSVITIARHPLDVLISAWRFRKFAGETDRWLGGNTELPQDHPDSPPCSDFFLDYACSFGAENLLSVTHQWWCDANTIKVRYEDIVAGGQKEFERLCHDLGREPNGLPEALSTFDLGFFQRLENHHGWQGRPGLWRELIVPDQARAIFDRHRHIFETLGYGIDSSIALTPVEARSNWRRLDEGGTNSNVRPRNENRSRMTG